MKPRRRGSFWGGPIHEAPPTPDFHYLVFRIGGRRTTLVLDYGDTEGGVRRAQRDYWLFEQMGADVVLLAADSLKTLEQTHASWFGDEIIHEHVSQP